VVDTNDTAELTPWSGNDDTVPKVDARLRRCRFAVGALLMRREVHHQAAAALSAPRPRVFLPVAIRTRAVIH
jgi:hypothetical protein